MDHGHSNPKSDLSALPTFGERLVLLRKSHGLTPTEVASAIGVSKVTLWKWENNRTFPRPDKLQRIASTFNIPASLLARTKKELSESLREKSFGGRLAALRKQRHLTLAYVGSQIGVSHVRIWEWESGRRYPDQEKLCQLAHVLQVSPYVRSHGEADESPELEVIRKRQLELVLVKAKEMIAIASGLPPSAVEITLNIPSR